MSTDLAAAAGPPIRATLHEIALESGDVDRLATFYGESLGYRFRDDARGRLGIGHDRRLRIVPGTAKRLSYAAYAVDAREDLDALAARLAAAGVDSAPARLPGMRDEAITFRDPDGNCFVFGLSEAGFGFDPADPGASRAARIQHVVFASTDAERLLGFFVDVIGFRLSDRVLDGEGGMRTAFVRCSHEHHSLAVFQASENRLDHHCYEAGEWNLIRDWADHFAQAHIPLKWGPGRHGPGNNLFLFIHDPDGNWVEISAELEHVAHDKVVGEWPHEERTLNSWGMAPLRS